MFDQEATHTSKMIINPAFKKQLLLLKNSALTELNIQISLDKMVSDKQYRSTVLTELDGLGSESLNELVMQLKRIPVYIKLAAPSVEAPVVEKTTGAAKKSMASILLFSLLLIIIVTGFVSWQNGYINITPRNAAVTEPVIEGKVSDEKIALSIPVESPAEVAVVNPIIVAAAVTKTISLPSDNPIISLRLHGSNTVGENLAPALLEAYLKQQSVTEMQWVAGQVNVERQLQYIQDEQVFAIELYAHGSSTGFKDLLTGKADMAMSSRKIKDKEIDQLRPAFGDLSLVGHEYIIGLDGLAVIVNPNNQIRTLTSDILAKIFSGEIKNWRDVGGEDMPINLYARDKNSGTWDTFNSLVLKVNEKQLSSEALRIESSSELSDSVANDIAAIGFIGLPYVNNSKALAIAASEETTVIYPTRFTISTEDYALSRRLYMYAPSKGNKMVQDFSHFVTTQIGQDVVEQVGLISQNIKLETAYKVKDAPKIYNDYTEVANRLSVNFRFKSGSNELDNKAKLDITRLVDYIAKNQGRRIVLMGFSDSLGDPQMNLSLSLVRANELEKELNAYGLNITAVEGFGEQLPIASNRSAMGRGKNRRVEVWVF